jgi:Ser/Thr protein kinase RdoA (MazF antagonist)
MTADAAAVLADFGIGPATVTSEPSLVSSVRRVEVADGRVWYLKEHPAADESRVRFAGAVAERLAAQGIGAPRLVPCRSGEPYALAEGRLFTLSVGLPGRPLDRAELREPAVAARVAAFVAHVHEALAVPPAAPVPPRPSLWHDGDHAARAAVARRALLGLPADPGRRALVRAMTLVAEQPTLQRALDAAPVPIGLVHGDLWPGNILMGPGPSDELAVLDLENACRAPLLLDVAHFIDLAHRPPEDAGRVDVARATAFARSYAAAADLAVEALAHLPDVLLAARGCTFLWTAERHLEVGPNPLDPLVADDVARVEHVLSIRDRWSEELSSSTPATAVVIA